MDCCARSNCRCRLEHKFPTLKLSQNAQQEQQDQSPLNYNHVYFNGLSCVRFSCLGDHM
jgi:hypothetical protein